MITENVFVISEKGSLHKGECKIDWINIYGLLDALAIDEPLEYARLAFEGNLQM